MSRVKNLKKQGVLDESLIDLAEQADQLHDIRALSDMPGGKALVSLLLTDVVGSVHRITTAKPEERDILCERLKANLALVRLIVNAKDNEEYIDEELKKILAE